MRAWLSSWMGEGGGGGEKKEVFSEEEKSLGLSEELLAFVGELASMPLTWLEFPVEVLLEQQHIALEDPAPLPPPAILDEEGEEARTGRQEEKEKKDKEKKEKKKKKEEGEGEESRGAPVPLPLSEGQMRHALLMLARCPPLAALRHRLCPRALSDDLFWSIYFALTRQHLLAMRVPLSSAVLSPPSPSLLPPPKQHKEERQQQRQQEEEEEEEEGGSVWAQVAWPPPTGLLLTRLYEWSVRKKQDNSKKQQQEEEEEEEEERGREYGRVYGPQPPATVAQMPRFACPLSVRQLASALSLSPSHVSALRRLLAAAALSSSHLPCPLLPILAASSLSVGMSEAAVFAVVCRQLRAVAPLAVSSSALLSASPRALLSLLCLPSPRPLCAALDSRMRVSLPHLWGRMRALGLSTSSFARPWFAQLFWPLGDDSAAPNSSSNNNNNNRHRRQLHSQEDGDGGGTWACLVHAWVAGGSDALLSMAMALLYLAQQHLLLSETPREFLASLSRPRFSPAAVLRIAPSFSLFLHPSPKRSDSHDAGVPSEEEFWWWPDKDPSGEWEGDPPSLPPYLRPVPLCASQVLASLQDPGLAWEVLCSWLPQRFRLSSPGLVYHSVRDGRSLRTLAQKAGAAGGPFVLMLHASCQQQQQREAVVGCFFTGFHVKQEESSSFVGATGEGEGFVWAAHGKGQRMVHWAWAGEPRERPQVWLGGGELVVADNAIVLDEDVSQGMCRPSSVFALSSSLLSDPAAPSTSEAFSCLLAELWHLHNV